MINFRVIRHMRRCCCCFLRFRQRHKMWWFYMHISLTLILKFTQGKSITILNFAIVLLFILRFCSVLFFDCAVFLILNIFVITTFFLKCNLFICMCWSRAPYEITTWIGVRLIERVQCESVPWNVEIDKWWRFEWVSQLNWRLRFQSVAASFLKGDCKQWIR